MMVIDLMNEAKNLNSSINNVANCEKAKMIRKKLVRIGGFMTVGGIIGLMLCFACFIIGAVADINSQIPILVIAGLICFLPALLVFGFGIGILRSGLKITINDSVTQAVNE